MAVPRLASLDPNPVTIGNNLTVTGTVPALSVVSNAVSSAAVALAISLSLGAVSNAGATEVAVLDNDVPPPQLISITPNPVAIGNPLTVSGTTGYDSAILLSSLSISESNESNAIVIISSLESLSQVTTNDAATFALRSPSPSLISIAPNPVTIGIDLTVQGAVAVVSLEGLSLASATEIDPLFVSCLLSGLSTPLATEAISLAYPVNIPSILNPGDREGSTGTTDGTNMILDPSEWVEYRINAGAGGRFTFLGQLVASNWGELELLIDNEIVATISYNGDFDEEENDPMPASTITPGENRTCVVAGSVWTRLDASQRSGRIRVILLNTSDTTQLGILLTGDNTQPLTTVPADIVLEANQGYIELPITEAIRIWGKPIGASDVVARITQLGN